MAIAAAHAMGRERGKKLRRWFSSQDVEGDAYDLVREVFSRSERTSLLRLSSQSAPRAVSSRRDRFGFGEVKSACTTPVVMPALCFTESISKYPIEQA